MELLFLIAIICLIAVLVVLSAYFASAETAYTSMNSIRVKNLALEGNKKAEKALRNYEHYDKLLTTALVGNNTVNVAISTLATMLCSELLGVVWGVVVATVLTASVILIFAEITPKTLAKRNAERYALAYAGSLHIAMTILSPILWAFMKLTNFLSRNAKNDSAEAPSFTEDELHVMIDEVTEEGALEHSEGELIKSAMQFDDIKVSEMYTPRSNMTVADIGGGIEALKQLFIDSEYSRIPIYERTMDRIIGAVHTKDFFSKYVKGENFTIGDILMPVKFIPESTSIATLLNDMQKAHIHMAIVLDNFGRTLGLVTMEDVLEELVGDIWDESDEAGYPVNQDKDGSFIVPGEAGIIEVMRKIGAEMPTCDLQDQSISAFVSGIIDGVPKRGDAVLLSNIKIIVRSMKSRRVKEVRIYLLKKEDIPEETQES